MSLICSWGRRLFAAAFLALASQAAQAADKCKITQVAELPVTMVGNRPTVPVKINGHEAPFFLDTGAMFGAINADWAARLGVHPHIVFGYRLKGVGGETDMQVANADEFTVGGMPFRHVDFFVPEQGLEPSIAGVVGENLLGAIDVEYDFANGVIRLFKPQDCGGKIMTYWATQGISIVPIEGTDPDKRVIVTPATINGQHVRAMWDSGSPRSLIALRSAAHAGVTPQTVGAQYAGKAGGVGPKVSDSWIVPFDSFAVGGEQVLHTRMRISDTPINDVDMLLGFDFFLSHRIYVANSQRKLYFTYNGGPVFRLDIAQVAARNAEERAALDRAATGLPATTPPPAAASGTPQTSAGATTQTPTDAAGYARRAAAFRARLDYPAAVADLDKAIGLEPENPQHYLARAQVFGLMNQPLRAMADFQEVLKRKPDETSALLGLGSLYAASRDGQRARAELSHALRAGADDPEVPLRVAGIYARTGFFEDALAIYDAWLAARPRRPNPDTDRAGAAMAAVALNGRCFTRAVLKRDLDGALADCDAAVKLAPRTPDVLDDRGLAHLARGEFDQAIADYDAALARTPKAALALYARGVAKLGKGQKEAGDADLAAARAINPRVADQARRLGVVAAGAASSATNTSLSRPGLRP